MLMTAANPQIAKPVPASRVPLIRPAARPDRNEPITMPAMVGTKNQPNWSCCSFR